MLSICEVARKLRIQYPGALYHVINRGNYRRAVFETAGAALAFEAAVAEACERHRWRVHAYATLPNHFHFTLETPDANLEDLATGWASYIGYLTTLANDTELQQRQGFDEMCQGWAIGTSSWRRELARQYAHLALNPGYEADELREIKESRWRAALERALSVRGLSLTEIVKDASADTAPWKIEVAAQLRREVAAPYAWIADALKIGNSASLRMQVHRLALHVSA